MKKISRLQVTAWVLSLLPAAMTAAFYSRLPFRKLICKGCSANNSEKPYWIILTNCGYAKQKKCC